MFDLIDFILNLAGLLLWLNWRSIRLDPFHRGIPATLSGTVRRAEPMRLKRWHFLSALVALLVIRAFFYGQIGPAVGWTPRLNLSIIAPAFPLARAGHVFYRSALLFSLLSFVLVIVIFYFWLLAIAVVNRRVTNPDALQKLLLIQLGRPAHWPLLIQLALPFVVCAALWMLCHPLLIHIGVTSPVRSNVLLLEQGLVLGLSACYSLRFLLVAFLVVYVVVSYVYLGTNPLWEFVSTTSRNILSPLKRLPLQFGKVNLGPVLVIILIVLVFYWPVPAQIRYFLDRHNLTLWPQ
jgi:uncharacterized protein YggT (Ycf19 family)